MIETADQFRGRTGIDWSRVQATLQTAAAAAQEYTLPRFRTKMLVDNKFATGFDPVTEADRAAETAIRSVIANDFPEHAILGEEWGHHSAQSDFCWIIDPIDGTRSFISGVPLWGTLIGLSHRGEIIAGLMAQPFTGETFIGGPGGSVIKRAGISEPLQTSGCTELGSARLFSTSPDLFDTPARKAAWTAMTDAALLTRYGCDCYAYCLLAAGHADLVVEARLNIYDIAALIPIIEQAGGELATWTGGTADAGGDIIAAATTELLDQALALIQSSQQD